MGVVFKDKWASIGGACSLTAGDGGVVNLNEITVPCTDADQFVGSMQDIRLYNVGLTRE
jgi:hypothetical protein